MWAACRVRYVTTPHLCRKSMACPTNSGTGICIRMSLIAVVAVPTTKKHNIQPATKSDIQSEHYPKTPKPRPPYTELPTQTKRSKRNLNPTSHTSSSKQTKTQPNTIFIRRVACHDRWFRTIAWRCLRLANFRNQALLRRPFVEDQAYYICETQKLARPTNGLRMNRPVRNKNGSRKTFVGVDEENKLLQRLSYHSFSSIFWRSRGLAPRFMLTGCSGLTPHTLHTILFIHSGDDACVPATRIPTIDSKILIRRLFVYHMVTSPSVTLQILQLIVFPLYVTDP